MPIEIERKFSLPDGCRVTALGDGLALGQPAVEELAAVYFDTPSLALARGRVTLRRRTGGADAGWHLKLPGGALGEDRAREEVHAPILEGASALRAPAELRGRCAELIGAEPLIPVAELRTTRTQRTIEDGDGRTLALLADDAVTAIRGGEATAWRELEVEIAGEGAPEDLPRIAAALIAAGAEPKASPSKLAQALGDALVEDPAELGQGSTAGEIVVAYLAEQVGVIQRREAGVRADAPDAVHKARVAVRRLRSTLRTFRDLLDAERTEALRAELRWLGEELGAPRDAEVLRERLLAHLGELPPEAVVDAVRTSLAERLDAAHAAAHAELVGALDGERCQTLLDELVRCLAEPPLGEGADSPAPKRLGRELRKAMRRVERRWDRAEAASGEEQMHWSHEARKKAKAARYGWEAAAPAIDGAVEVAAAWEAVTEALGSVQDGAVARIRLAELAAEARAAGEPDFTYGVLWEREGEHQEASYDEGAEAIEAAIEATRAALKAARR